MKATLIALMLGAAAVATATAGQPDVAVQLHVTVYARANLPEQVSNITVLQNNNLI